MIPVANAAIRPLHVRLFALLLPVLLAGAAVADPVFVRLETEAGDILLVMYPELAPNHVGNFTHLARTGFYDGTSFHRIVPGFVIQGGDPKSKDDDPRNDGTGGPTIGDVLTENEQSRIEEVNALLESKGYAGIEAMANLKAEFSPAPHVRGSLSMARSRHPDSAGSQFFICVDRTATLDSKYTLFGHVVAGMDVADAIVAAEKNPAAGRDAPAAPVVIEKAVVLEGAAELNPAEQEAWAALGEDFKANI